MSGNDEQFVSDMLAAAREFGEDLQQPTDPDDGRLVWKLLDAERELSAAMGLPPDTAAASTIGFLDVALEDAIDLHHLKAMLRRRTLDAREHAEAERRTPPRSQERAGGMQ